MTPEFALRNLGLYSLQILVLTAVAGLLPWALRLRAPRPQLAFWYAVLAICILLPVVQPWAPAPAQPAGGVTFTSTVLLPGGDAAGAGLWAWWPGWAAAALIVIAIGAALRLLSLALGLWRLHRLRSRAEYIAGAAAIDDAITATATTAEFLCSADIAGPVTFGFRRPAVLLPPGFFDLEPIEQRSVAIHELLHVARRDWLYTLAEEFLRAVLWFHPAIWFLLNRVQLAREQTVDETVVRHTQCSNEYVGALLKIAAARIEPDLAPAPLFLRKRHLRERVAAIVQGASMSKRRVVLTMTASLAALPLVAALLAWHLPLQAAPQEVRDTPGVEVRTGAFKVLHRTAIDYPADARKKGLSGDVVVAVTVNSDGTVTDARVVNGPPELRKAVLESVLDWHFSMDPVEVSGAARPVPSSFEVAVRFQAPAGTVDPAAPAPVGRGSMTLDRIFLNRVPAGLRDRVAAAMTVRSGDAVTPEQLSELMKSLAAIDRHLRIQGTLKNDETAMDLQVFLMTDRSRIAKQQDTAPNRIRVGGNLQALNLVQKVTPKYPFEAKEARVQGQVRLQAVIAKDGTVQNLELISGPPELVDSAMNAVKQWVYRPTLLNGNPVEVITQIDVNYTLTK